MAFVTDTDLVAAGAGQGANMVGFAQPGAAAFTRTAMEKLRETVSVTDFCVADGVTPQHAQLQALIDTGVRKIVFPQGTKVAISEAINLRSNLEIELQQGAEIVADVDDYALKAMGGQVAVAGPVLAPITRYALSVQLDGASSKVGTGDMLVISEIESPFPNENPVSQIAIVQKVSGNFIFFETPLNYPISDASNIILAIVDSVHDLKLTGYGAISNTENVGGGGVRFNLCRDITVEGITVHHTGYIGMSIELTWNSIVNNLRTDDTGNSRTGGGGTGLGFRGSSYGIINGFIGARPRSDEALTFFTGCSYFKVISPRIVQFLNGDDPGGASGNCILIDKLCSHIDLVSPMCAGSATYAIFVNNQSDYCTVTDYQIAKAELAGIRIANNCTSCTVGSGVITDVIQTVDTDYRGGAPTAAVVIDGSNENCSVVGQVVFQRIAGGGGVVDEQSIDERGSVFVSKGGVNASAPYLGWDVRGALFGATTRDFVKLSSGTALALGLTSDVGNADGFINVGINGDGVVGKLVLAHNGGPVAVGASTLPVYSDNVAAASLPVGQLYRDSSGVVRQRF